MKRILVLLIGIIFLGIAGCNRGGSSSKTSKTTKGVSNSTVSKVDTLKLDFEEETNSAVPVGTNVEVIEPIVTIGTQKPVAVKKAENISVTSESTAKSENKQMENIPEEKQIVVRNTQALKTDRKIPVKKSKIVTTSVKVYHKGSYIRVGKDISRQLTSPRRPIQITAVVFNKSKWGRYADFRVYAVPTHSKLTKSSKHLIASYNNIVLVNSQAQLTKFWNGKNIYGHFLGKGNYNIYLYYRVKNRKKRIIYTEGRYWGHSRNYYLRLY